MDLRPEGHPNRSNSLNDLAFYLMNRYDAQGNTADLEESIILGQTALELWPPGHPDRHLVLDTLGNVLRRRFLKLGSNADLNEAISFL